MRGEEEEATAANTNHAKNLRQNNNDYVDTYRRYVIQVCFCSILWVDVA